MRDDADEKDFEGYKEISQIGKDDEVVDHYPPQYIIGTPFGEETTILSTEIEDIVRVNMIQMTCEYCFSNPTNMFNLSITDRKWKPPVGIGALSYGQWKKNRAQRESG